MVEKRGQGTTAKGAEPGPRMASPIETCKVNAVDADAYLRKTLTAITNGHPASHIDDLMPWPFQKRSN